MTFGFIDSHAHISFPDYDKDRKEVLKRAFDADLEYIITIGAGEGLQGNISAVKLAEKHEKIFATVGIHPHDASKVKEEWYAEIYKLIKSKKVVAIGEAGLDFYRNKVSKEDQIKCFKRLLEIAHQVDLPMVIHSRQANEEVWDILQEVGVPSKKGVFHCFSGDLAFAEKIVKAGFYISIPGIVTFENAKELQSVVSEIPLERILLETDCPYLTPVPFRGKRNEPSYIPYIAEKIAKIKSLSKDDVRRITSIATKRLFNLPGAEVISSIAYPIRNSLYLNITNRCNLSCTFCPKCRFGNFEVKGHYLKLENEPSVEEVFQAMGEPCEYEEIVFCGYGEPTTRIELLKTIAKRLKELGVKKIRLNTDGMANLVYKRNIVKELKGLIDSVSVSLNAFDAKTFNKLCPSKYGEDAFDGVLDFIKEAKKYIPELLVTAVAVPELDIGKIQKLADSLGVKLRIREFMNMG